MGVIDRGARTRGMSMLPDLNRNEWLFALLIVMVGIGLIMWVR